MSVRLDEAAATRLAIQIGEMFSGLYNELGTCEVPQLGVSFNIWSLDINNLSSALAEHKTLAMLATPTSLQHHQIWLGDKARAYAVSEPAPEDTRRVIRTSISVVAERMHDAITFLNEDNADTDWDVRLLLLPAIITYAFWLVKGQQGQEQKLYLFSAPDRFRELPFPGYIDPAEKFLNLLGETLEIFAPFKDDEIVYW